MSEGEIQGLVDGAKSIYFNDTQLVASDGSSNFNGVTWDYRSGTPSQGYMGGFPAAENEVSVGVQIKKFNDQVRSISSATANAVRFTIQIDALYFQDLQSGDMHGSSVQFEMAVRQHGGGWITNVQTITGKTTGPFQQSYRMDLPSTGPWDIRVARWTDNNTQSNLANNITWVSYTEITDHMMEYPSTAYIGVAFDAALFGNSLPQRSYEIYGMIVRIPSNYDSWNKTYNGVWDGSFARGWTDNPAWIYYDLCTNSRYGAGLTDSQVDRFTLYSIAQYCDQTVPDGFGGSEPRFTCNVCINTRQESFAVLSSLTSVFRSMAYWASGSVMLSVDAPADPIMEVTAANTMGGFSYSGPSRKARHTSAYVTYLDKTNGWQSAIEVYEDPDAIREFGWNPAEVTAFACTSRGQAHRVGKWLVDTELNQGDTVTYKCSIDHVPVSPGSIIEIADPDYQGWRMGGRVISGTASSVVLDAPVTYNAGNSYTITFNWPDGRRIQRGAVAASGDQTHWNLTTGAGLAPDPGIVWVMTADNLAPRQFRVIGISEDNPGEYTIAALFHDPTKYARVEFGINLASPSYSALPSLKTCLPPTNLQVTRDMVTSPSGWTSVITLSWDASPDPFVRGYQVRYRRNSSGWNSLQEVTSTTASIYGEGGGNFTFWVQAVNFASVYSAPLTMDVFIPDTSSISLLTVTGLEIAGQGNNYTFASRDVKFDWNNVAVRGAYPLGSEGQVGQGFLDPNFRDYEFRVYGLDNVLLFTAHTLDNYYTFTFAANQTTRAGPHRYFIVGVVARDRWGNVSSEARIQVQNPPPAQPLNLQVTPGYGTVFVSYDKPTDEDYAGTLIWAADHSGFTPDGSTLVYDDVPTYASVRGVPGQMIYIRVAAYDAFSRTELNISAEFAVRVGGYIQDVLPPHVPTNVGTTVINATGEDGTMVTTITVTWDASPDKDINYYGLAIAEGARQGDGTYAYGSPVFFVSDKNAAPSFSFTARSGNSYQIAVNATDTSGNTSQYSAAITVLATGDAVPPGAPTALRLTGAFKSVWLSWDPPTDPDYAGVEIWTATSNDRTSAALSATAGGQEFTLSGFNTGATLFFWLRAFDTSGNLSDWFPADPAAGQTITLKGTATADYQQLSIVSAAIADLAVDDAKIASLDASKIIAGSVIAGNIRVGSSSGPLLSDSGGDPAAKINSGTTLIDPGKILISGGTTLFNWTAAGDTTKIWGGAISANTIQANALSIGARNITFDGLEFTADPSTNVVTWTAGGVSYVNDAGVPVRQAVKTGTMPAFSSMRYIYWAKGNDHIDWDTDPLVAYRQDTIVLGTYWGGTDLIIDYARTVIDGTKIRTGSIVAQKIAAGTISARELASSTLITQTAQIQDAVITNAKIQDATITSAKIHDLTADRIGAGVINAGAIYLGKPYGTAKGFLALESLSGMRRMSWWDTAGRFRAYFGQLGTSPNDAYDGVGVYDQSGNLIFNASGLGLNVVGTASIQDLSVQTLKIAGESVGVVRAATTFNTVNLDTGNNSHGGGGWQDYSIVSHQINVPVSSPVVVQFNMWTGSPPGILTLDDTDPRFGNGPSWRFSRAPMYAGTGYNGGDFQCILRYKRDGGQLFQVGDHWQTGDRGGGDPYGWPITYFETTPPSSLVVVDYPGAGQHTYEISASVGASGGQVRVYWDAASICTTTLMR